MNNKTYSLNETLPMATAGKTDMNQRSIRNKEFWIEEVSYFQYGRCHTLNNTVVLGTDKWTFGFDNKFAYNVFIYDPRYSVITANPATMPSIFLDLDPTDGVQYLHIEAIKHININRAGAVCEEDEKYSFTACIKESVTKTVGCR